jgi:DNA helicase TIP49 (TBP-interacting protein)
MNRDLTERTRTGDGGQGEPLFTVDEIRRVFAKNKIKLANDACDYLCRLANLPEAGGLGTCVDLVALSTKVHQLQGVERITEQMIRNVQRTLSNWHSQQILEERIGEQGMRIAKVG